MKKTMYEINYHADDGLFSHCTIRTISVIRVGVLPGCSGVSLTAIDEDGNKFQGSPDNYFDTKEEAVSELKKELQQAIKMRENDIHNLVKECENIKRSLICFEERENAET